MFGFIREVEEVTVHNQECALQMEFAQCHPDWTIHDWYEVIFSDHTKINRFQVDGYTWCWVRDDEFILQTHHVS